MSHRYILTLSCKDTVGIVSAVASFLAQQQAFIIESAQHGDATTGLFFMRTVFTSEKADLEKGAFNDAFSPVAEQLGVAWKLHNRDVKQRILLMVSKQGHCLNDLLHRWSSNQLHADIVAVVSNHHDMEKMVQWHDIPFHYLPVTKETKSQQESQVLELVKHYNVDLVVLARYMQILSKDLVKEIYGKTINIHHSFLPSFKGAKPYHQAFDRGVKIIGATAHYVSNDLDEGPIIEQEVTRVDHVLSPNKLVQIGRDVESLVLSRAVEYHLEQRIILNENKTVVFK